ncbi:hypothetical protein D3C87_587640 [compost metagenome]
MSITEWSIKNIKILNAIKSLLRITLVVVIAIVLMGFSQFAQILTSNRDIRQSEWDAWAGTDAKRQQQVIKFKDVCINSNTGSRTISLKDCAKLEDLQDVEAITRSADEKLISLAWPISMLFSGEKLEIVEREDNRPNLFDNK